MRTAALLTALALLGLVALAPAASAVVRTDSTCAPVQGIVNEICVTVTLVMFSTSTSFCTSQGVTVFPGETCYSVEYDLSAHALLPVGDVTGIATGGHFTISCGPQTSSCSATTGAFAVSAVSPHCDSVHGRANHLVFQTPEANTGLTCV